MAKIYSTPDEVKVPELSFNDIAKYKKDCEIFEQELRDWLKNRKPFEEFGDEFVGEVISFPVADGYAQYMVSSSNKPVELIHMPLWDEYYFEYDHRLTSKDVKDKVKQQKAIEKIFPKR